jgi:hypothetical protein
MGWIRDPKSGIKKKLIPDPDLGLKRHRIQDMDPQHRKICTVRSDTYGNK